MKKRYLVSRCLLGEPCRYDGRDKCSPAVCRLDAEFLSVCPETDAGYGVPREPMHVSDGRMITNNTMQDVTADMVTWAERYLEKMDFARFDGVILKKRSPSCDPCSGVFAALLQQKYPDIPIFDEENLPEK